jgi:L-lactate dehydrogenase
VIGSGSVGVAAAYASFVRRIASEILLVDRDVARAEGEAMDLMHGQALVGRIVVRAADWSELDRAGVVLVAAGANQKRGESRLDLLTRNADVMREVIERLDRHAPEAVVIIATNPVDILTRLAVGMSARDESRVLGTGTMLDSARFRALIGDHFGTSPRSVHAYVLGEHGDSQVPIWSNAALGGVPLSSLSSLWSLDETTRAVIEERTRRAAADVIARKGFTNLAIGLVMAELAEVVLSDQRSVHTISVILRGEFGLSGVALGLPCTVGCDGVVGRLVPELSEGELARLRRSAELLDERARRAGIA